MTEQPTPSSDQIRPLDTVIIAIIIATVGGSALLLSVPETTELMEGAIPWHEQSMLRAVVQLLCVNYAIPTFSPGEVKVYLLGLGAGLALLALAVAASVRRREAQTVSAERNTPTKGADDAGDVEEQPIAIAKPKTHVAPLVAAQILIGLYLLWSFASGRWSASPDLAEGASLLLSVHVLWAFAIGNGLRPRAARLATYVMVTVTGVVAGVAVWYFYGRNPGLRAMFPFGNPIFLATCLIPGMLLSGALILERLGADRGGRARKSILTASAAALVIALSGWAFCLAGSRGPALGLVFGALVMAFLAVRGRAKAIPVVIGLAVLASGWLYFTRGAEAFSPTGRSATIRLRQYTWSYAWRMFHDKPFTGHGQAAFVMKGDAHAVNDILNDPQVFETRIVHAHNEWLEVMADLGAVGIVLLLGGLLITLRAGMLALDRPRPSSERWALIGLMGGLVGLMVTETFSVGLRVSGVPTFFFTVLGLTWAMSATAAATGDAVGVLSSTPARRTLSSVIGVALAVAALAVTQNDWYAARSEYSAAAALGQAQTDEDIGEAINLAATAVTRLNPQRALTSLVFLSETRLRAAEMLQLRALDRERRAAESEPVNTRLLMMADEDYRLSDEHCKAGTHALKELVSRSPGFFNHGLLECRINLARARNAEAHARISNALNSDDDVETTGRIAAEDQAQFVGNAVAAIKRELLRQPFNAIVAVQYARIAPPDTPFADVVDALARPLRYGRITPAYVDLMDALLGNPRAWEAFQATVREARRALTIAVPLNEAGDPIELWAPERLRLAAMVAFMQGNYPTAVDALEVAATGYDPIAESAAFGAASCYAELADARFFAGPLAPQAAIEAAAHAIELAPGGRRGGELQSSVRRRLVDYSLASGDEDGATNLLRAAASRDVSDEIVAIELASRYHRLCESMLARSTDGRATGIAAADLFGPPAPSAIEWDLIQAMTRWISRAAALNPDDAQTLQTAALVALERGDPAQVVKYLESAIEKGLPPEHAGELADVGLRRFPLDEHLTLFRSTLADRRDTTPPQ